MKGYIYRLPSDFSSHISVFTKIGDTIIFDAEAIRAIVGFNDFSVLALTNEIYAIYVDLTKDPWGVFVEINLSISIAEAQLSDLLLIPIVKLVG